MVHNTSATAGYITSATNGQLLWCPSTNNCTGAYYRAQDLEAGTVADFFTWQDQNSIGGEGYWNNGDNADIGTWLLNRASAAATPTTSTYNLFEDQVTLAGEVYTDAKFANFTKTISVSLLLAVIPIENFAVLEQATITFTLTLFQPIYGPMVMLVLIIVSYGA